MSSTLATGFRRHGAQTGIRQNSRAAPHTRVYINPLPPFSGSIKNPSPSSHSRFWSSQLVSERALIFVSSPSSRSVGHTLIFFSCSYVRKNWIQSKGTWATGVDTFVEQKVRLTKEFWLFPYFSSKPPLLPFPCYLSLLCCNKSIISLHFSSLVGAR